MIPRNIFFVGDTKTPFIQQDVDLLKEDYGVTVFSQIFSKNILVSYLFACLNQWKNIRTSHVVYIWFADYPVIPFVIMAKLTRTPIIINVGGWEIYNEPSINFGNQLNLIRGYATRWILRRADRIVVPSHPYVRILNEIAPGVPVTVIHNWIDDELCRIPLPEKEPLAVTACCAESAKIAKGVHIFEAVSDVPCEMKVLGGLSRKEYFATLKRAKVYCQLSLVETFGISLLEAMACGCVPVVTNCDALPYIVGGSGIVVRYGDVHTTEEAIKKALTMDGQMARDRARFFSRDKKKKALENLLDGLK